MPLLSDSGTRTGLARPLAPWPPAPSRGLPPERLAPALRCSGPRGPHSLPARATAVCPAALPCPPHARPRPQALWGSEISPVCPALVPQPLRGPPASPTCPLGCAHSPGSGASSPPTGPHQLGGGAWRLGGTSCLSRRGSQDSGCQTAKFPPHTHPADCCCCFSTCLQGGSSPAEPSSAGTAGGGLYSPAC